MEARRREHVGQRIVETASSSRTRPAVLMLLALLLTFQQVAPVAEPIMRSTKTGTEWMVVASILIPAVLIAVIIWMGSRRMVY